MGAINWELIYQQHRGKWVALRDDEETVIASAPTLKEVLERAVELGHPDPIVTTMPDQLRTFIG